MDRFDRQIRIAGWNQEAIRGSRVVVCGRDWLGTFTAWGLASLGVGEILWIGKSRAATDRLAHWFLADPCPFSGCSFFDYPFEVEHGVELRWAFGGARIDAVVSCSQDPEADDACRRLAGQAGFTYLSGAAAAGGWIGSSIARPRRDGADHPITAMIAAALLVDSVRERLSGGGPAAVVAGDLSIAPPPIAAPFTCVIAGVGGIGVYAATLAAAMGCAMTLVDFDRVDATNLNRQGLFGESDADREVYKAIAAKEALERFFAGASVTADIHRVDDTFASRLRGTAADVVLSAVDNARTRLILQSAARETALPLVQGGTDVFAADCYSQGRESALIDEQMYGALSHALAQEDHRGERRSGGCAGTPSYVVPGMLAAGLMMYRALQVCAGHRALPPMHWRSGDLPVEQRSETRGFEFAELSV